MANQIPQAHVNIDPNTLKTVQCTCEAFVFENVFVYKVIPALYSQTGQTTLAAMQCLRCIKCGTIHSMEDVLKSVQ